MGVGVGVMIKISTPTGIRITPTPSNSSTFELNTMVISPYQHEFTLLKSDIVYKLTNANDSLSNSPYELQCTVQEIQSDLQQTTLANQILLNQVTIHTNESLESISQLGNETKNAEILLNKLNKTVETAREHIRLGEIAVNKARQHFSDVIDSIRDYKCGRGFLSDDYERDDIFGRYNSRDRFSSHRGGLMREFRCHFDVMHDPWYKSSAQAMHEAQDKLTKQQQQLAYELAKYNAIQSQLRNYLEEITALNTTLQEQRRIKIVTDALNKDFLLITNRLKPFSSSSKRLIDVLTYVLDYQTIVEPLNSIYDKLLNENMIEATNFKPSKKMMDKIKQKVIYLTTKLPQMRYRRKQFQPCIHLSQHATN